LTNDDWRVLKVGMGVLAVMGMGEVGMADPRPVNYDEAKVGAYTLPDPLVFADGSPVRTAADWGRRRAELLALFEEHVYGRMPGRPQQVAYRVTGVETGALGGLATRKQLTLALGNAGAQVDVHALLYVPNAVPHPVPAFLSLNFRGNHSMHSDSGIDIPCGWMGEWGDGATNDHRATEAGRGIKAEQGGVERVLGRGYAVVTAYYGDLDPDVDDGFRNGVHPLFDGAGGGRRGDAWGAIGAWAWGMSRILDYLETDGDIDATRVAAMGHSRLGKTALWAGAQDTRFAMVISNNSGCGGAALSRRDYGETVARINAQFPHWFCANFRRYDDREEGLPVDQHELLALIAPRPLYVASATADTWADPRGEFLALRHADPVYRLLGTDGLGVREQPVPETPSLGTLAYHLRTGAHGVTAYDWERYCDFADRHWRR
jgi:hypothetical protein